jgi:hypothetical protein
MNASWKFNLPVILVLYHIIVCALLMRENSLNALMVLELPVMPVVIPMAFIIPFRGNSTGGIVLVGVATGVWIAYGRYGEYLDRRLQREAAKTETQ